MKVKISEVGQTPKFPKFERTMAYQVVLSTRGKDKLVFEGFVYRHQRSRGRNHYFRCERKKMNAMERQFSANSGGGNAVAGQPHSHNPEEAREKILRMVSISMVRQDGKTNSQPSGIIQIHRQEVPAKGAHTMPTDDALRQVVQSARRKHGAQFP